MKGKISAKIFELVFEGVMFLILGTFISLIAISSQNWIYITFTFLGVIICGALIFSEIKQVEKLKNLIPTEEQFIKYLKANNYDYLAFSYPKRGFYPSLTSEKIDRWLIIFEPHERCLGFSEVKSEFPELYQFFKSEKEPNYLLVQNKYFFETILYKK